MYKVLLVDDEHLVLDSLEGSVNWEKHGFRVVGRAGTGTKALQMCRQLKPHVVFTDIRMPGITGLELIKKLKDEDRNVQCVIISGYAEFSYVQRGVQYGIIGYCLKPFDEHEICQLLDRAREQLDEVRRKSQYDLLDLLGEAPSRETAAAIKRIFECHEIYSEDIDTVVTVGRGRLPVKRGARAIQIHLGHMKGLLLCESLAQALGEPSPEILGIGVARGKLDYARLTDAVEAATTRAWQFFMSGERFSEGIDPAAKSAANILLGRLEAKVRKRDTNAVCDGLGELASPLCRRGLTITDCVRVHNLIHAVTSGTSIPQTEYIHSPEQLHAAYGSLDAMLESLTGTVRQNLLVFGRQPEHDVKSETLRGILEHIDANYEKNITLQSIARDFYINPNYVSQLFTKQTGNSFTEYVTKVRLHHAKELLDTTAMTTAEIAEQVGIKDYFYFIKLFSKTVGVTPKQYRNREAGTEIPEGVESRT